MKKLVTVPRIIGIVLLIIAILAYQNQGAVQVGILAIAGLILLLTNKDKAARHWQVFLDTLKPRKEFALVMLYDAFFYALLAVLLLVAYNVLKGPYEEVRLLSIGSGGITLGALEGINATIKNFFVATVISLLILWILIVIIYSLSRGLIWHALLNKKAKPVFFTKFTLLNLLWCTGWLLLALFLLSSMQPMQGAYAFIITIILYTHLTTILHHAYTRTPMMSKAATTAFGTGLGHLASFTHPYAYVFVIYLILSQAQRLATTNTAQIIIVLITQIVFMAWYRTYLNNVLKRLA